MNSPSIHIGVDEHTSLLIGASSREVASGLLLPLEKMTKSGQARVLDVYMYSSGHMGLEKNMGHGPNIDRYVA